MKPRTHTKRHSWLSLLILTCAAAAQGPAHAGVLDEGIKLYNDKQYFKAAQHFSKNRAETFKNPVAEYYFALSLAATGSMGNSVEVCHDIIARFPASPSATQAKLAIQRWSKSSPPELDADLGIIGVKFGNLPEGATQVIEVFPDSPADKQLSAGDEIIEIDGSSVRFLGVNEIFNRIAGKPRTHVSVTFRRNDEQHTVDLVRVSCVEYAKLHPDIAKRYR